MFNMPTNFKKALSKITMRSILVLGFFIVWELLKDRLAGWANSLIDEKFGVAMDIFAKIIKELAIAPLEYTAIIAIVIIILVFLHAYFTESKNAAIAPEQQPKLRKEPIVISYSKKQPDSSFKENFDYFAGIRDAGLNSTYTKLRELYRNGLKIKDEYDHRLEHIFPNEDNKPADKLADNWANDVYNELNRSLPTEAFKFCHSGNTTIEKYSQFVEYIEILREIIERYGDK